MSSVGAEGVKLYICEKRFGLAREGQPAIWCEAEASALDAAVLVAAAGTAPRRLRRERLEVQVSGALARPFLLATVQGLRDRAELERLALLQGALATGLGASTAAGSTREPALWLGPATTEEPADRVGVVLATGLRELIVGFSEQARLKLVSIRPWWVQALHADPARRLATSVAAARDEDSVTLLAAHEGKWCAAETYAPCPDGVQIEAAVRRLELSLGDRRGGTLRLDRAIEVARGEPTMWLDPQPLDAFA